MGIARVSDWFARRRLVQGRTGTRIVHRRFGIQSHRGPGGRSSLRMAQVPAAVFSRIGYLVSVHLPPWTKRVNLRAIGISDFPHFNTSRQQRICDQGAMTAPGNSFCTHNCRRLQLRKFYQIIQMLLELRRLHVVGEAAETGVAPSGVERIPPRMPEAA